jgi:hypothetical protein
LQLKNENRSRVLDLGWYPSFNPHGKYRLLLIELSIDPDEQAELWEKPLLLFESRDIEEVQRTIDTWMDNNQLHELMNDTKWNEIRLVM